ncbi:RFX DNA-binding domain-containing protein [Daldinia sp. FL1419]|nr:RFX DNA-binding domain-containing protein [Daldinia sp. FL1419]
MSQHNQRQRTMSRASTASIHSVATQPTLEQQAMMAHHGAFPDQWVPNDHASSRDMSSAVQPMSAGDMMLRPTSQLQVGQSFAMGSGMHSAVGIAMPYAQHPNLHPAVSAESFAGNTSFTDADSQMMDRDEADEVDSLASRTQSSKPSSRTSANNELEMRQLFQANKQRTLAEVAKELHGNERGPNSERARQIFAMLWINGVCTKGKGSVPRGRVYANYASRCATERITVLNPASFGKLVRVLFPGLKTRRLGVRGESKYHYVNFNLVDDQPTSREASIQPAIPFPEPTPFARSVRSVSPAANSFAFPVLMPNSATHSQSPALDVQHSALPSPTLVQQPDTPSGPRSGSSRSHSLYNQCEVKHLDQLHSTNAKTIIRLAFVEPEHPSKSAEPLILPKIEPFLPNGTDPDAAMSLTALYRSHCTSLVECIRYCKEKAFFHLYTSFQGTLTMPVQKLFSHPSIAPWIEECDYVLYQRMIQIIYSLVLQAIPQPVLNAFEKISQQLVSHIRESFQGQPRHVVQAKEAPATIFAGLLDRTLRVNLTAHAAANMLSIAANRDQMYLDWIAGVRVRKLAECVPTRGMDDLVDLLFNDIRDLIDPVNVPWSEESKYLYGEIALNSRRGLPSSNAADGGSEHFLERWVDFLLSLQKRFPYATATDIVWCVERVGTEVMRDLTMRQSNSFGAWWVTKCWLDEMVSFLAEYGGFMKSKNSQPPIANEIKPPVDVNDVRIRGPRVSSDDQEVSHISHPQPDRAPFPSQLEVNGVDSLHMSANHDDSGIGIRTPEEDFPIEKFEYQDEGHDQSLHSLNLEEPVQ